jgi:hypothetical protein
MALKEADIANFETLQRAFKDGSLALVECQDFKTGEYRALRCEPARRRCRGRSRAARPHVRRQSV